MNQPVSIPATYGRTADGDLAALVCDTAYAAIPGREGLRIATAWRLEPPLCQWKRADFYGAVAVVGDAAGFHDYVRDQVQHREEKLRLGRVRVDQRVWTPWDISQTSEIFAEGVVFYSTASHGGFKLDDARSAEVPDALRCDNGWYEEDEDWSIVAVTFPALFTTLERRHADRTVRNAWPDYWESVHGRELAPGESWAKDRRLFLEAHAQDWIVVAAITSKEHPGMVECGAALGGKRNISQWLTFLVSDTEYVSGRFGFVIDESRHRRI
ncbi:MAG: hypothetical protein WCY29_10055 [Novosphingobium sp.]